MHTPGGCGTVVPMAGNKRKCKRKDRITVLEYVLKDRSAAAGGRVSQDFKPFQQLTREQLHRATRIAVQLVVEERPSASQALHALFDEANAASSRLVDRSPYDIVAERLVAQGWDPSQAT